MLTSSLFMLEVYDRVLPSRSVPTLVGLSGPGGHPFDLPGALDDTRGRLLVRIGGQLDGRLSPRVYDATRAHARASREGRPAAGPRPRHDPLFLSGAGPTALFDLPWVPLYLAICFAFHP